MRYSPYSFSKINTYKHCQKKFEWTYVNKKNIDKNYSDPAYFQRGRFIHQYIAKRLLGQNIEINGYASIEIDDKLNLINQADEALENDYINITFDFDITEVEQPIKLDKSCKISKSKKDSMFTGFIDYYAVHDNLGVIVDWKSGKFKDRPSFEQLQLYSIWLIEKYPQIDEIDLLFYYIEHNKFNIITIDKQSIIKFRDNLLSDISTIEKTDTFSINPSKQCVYCPFFESCLDEFNILI